MTHHAHVSMARLWWIAAKPIIDPVVAVLTVYAVIKSDSFAWTLLLSLAPGAYGIGLSDSLRALAEIEAWYALRGRG
jgi:hypothetical protein